MSEDPPQNEPHFSTGSTPDGEFDGPVQEAQPPQPVKRKGGRKPVYATVEERKQRNRQAQAAFRERRTEYIKQLESAMKENEEAMEHLQQTNRETTEECHMLRYKTSLLEDLLYENGIDYQSELQSRSSKSLLGSPFAAQTSGRMSWPQQAIPDTQRDNRQRPQQQPQKLKAKNKFANSQGAAHQRTQSLSFLPNGPSHRLNTLQYEPTSLAPSGFNHSNGTTSSMHPSMQRPIQQFEDLQLDPSISPNGHGPPYFSPDSHHLADFLDPERFPDSNAYREQSERQARPHSGHYRHARQLAMSPQDRSKGLGNQRQRATPNRPVYRQSSFAQGQAVDSDAMELSGNNALPDDLTFGNDVMI